MRKTNKLCISYVKPYGAVTRSTISRWLKSLMSSAGIDISKYSAHSIRSAAASKGLFCTS